ncbi:MAG: hypothetical protein GC182_15540 [Rhodopseudomonas sp.]|nr:hypothetical protein [Rhodopseudomonas sp.]
MVVGALAAFAIPVYYATRPQVYDNPPLADSDPLLNSPIIGERDVARMPLAVLHHRVIVDPKMVAALNAEIKKAAPVRQATAKAATESPAHMAEHHAGGGSVAELQPEPRHSTFFLFRLFGG